MQPQQPAQQQNSGSSPSSPLTSNLATNTIAVPAIDPIADAYIIPPSTLLQNGVNYAQLTAMPVKELASYMGKNSPVRNATTPMTALGDVDLDLFASSAAYLEAQVANTNADTIWKVGSGGGAFVAGTGILSKAFVIAPPAGASGLDQSLNAIIATVPIWAGLAIFSIATIGALWQNYLKVNRSGNVAAWTSLVDRVTKSRQ